MPTATLADQRQDLLRRLVDGPFVDPAAYALLPLDGGRTLLVPRRQRAVQRSALLDYPGMQSRPERLARLALFAALSAPAAPWLPTAGGHDTGRTGGDLWRLIGEITYSVDTEVVWCAAVLRRPGAHWTPVIHLFDGSSRRIAVAKLALSDRTAGNVRREAAALGALGGHHRGLTVPGLIGSASLDASTFVAVMTPLPAGVRAMAPGRNVDADVVVDLVEAAGGPHPAGTPSSYVDELRLFVAGLALDPALAARCAELLSRPVPVGRCHGDLVPWNAATTPGAVVLWDFEYSYPDAPLGVDAVQGRYRLAREHGVGVTDALAAAAVGASSTLDRLGLGADDRRTVGGLHAVDAARRIHAGVDASGTSSDEHVAALRAAVRIAAVP